MLHSNTEGCTEASDKESDGLSSYGGHERERKRERKRTNIFMKMQQPPNERVMSTFQSVIEAAHALIAATFTHSPAETSVCDCAQVLIQQILMQRKAIRWRTPITAEVT